MSIEQYNSRTVCVRILYQYQLNVTLIVRLSSRLSKSSRKSSKYIFSARTLSVESRSTLPDLSLVMEFLGNVFTAFIFEKLLSHEALVTGRVTATTNQTLAINQRCTTCGRVAACGLRQQNLRPSACNLKNETWRPCWRILKQNKRKARKSVDTMRNNLDGDATKSYRKNTQFDIYRIKPIF